MRFFDEWKSIQGSEISGKPGGKMAQKEKERKKTQKKKRKEIEGG